MLKNLRKRKDADNVWARNKTKFIDRIKLTPREGGRVQELTSNEHEDYEIVT